MNSDIFTSFFSIERLNMFNPNQQYNDNDLNQLNNLMGRLQQNYHPQQQARPPKQQTVKDVLQEEAKKQQMMNDKMNAYVNSRDRYEHTEHQQQYNNPQVNNSFNGLNAYQHSLNDDNMFPKDLRENINNKTVDRLFENVSDNKLPLISEIRDEHNMILNYKPHFEQRSKNLYKQQTNERLNDYSPLARSAYIPTMSANSANARQEQMRKLSPRDVMNQRLNNFEPLSCNISLKKPNNDNKNVRTSANYEKQLMTQNARYQKAMNDINHIDKGACNNVVSTHMPVSTTN